MWQRDLHARLEEIGLGDHVGILAPQPPVQRQQQPSFEIGHMVRIHSLPSHLELNGSLAVVVPPTATDALAPGRTKVKLMGSAQVLAVRSTNLILVQESEVTVRCLRGATEDMTMGMGATIVDRHRRSVAQQTLSRRRRAQRRSLEHLLAYSAPQTNPLLIGEGHLVIECGLNSDHLHPRDLLPLMRVCRAWAAAVRAWLHSAAALPFWQRVCAGMLPGGAVLHPELATPEMLLQWVRAPMVHGTREEWQLHDEGHRSREYEEDDPPTTEFEVCTYPKPLAARSRSAPRLSFRR